LAVGQTGAVVRTRINEAATKQRVRRQKQAGDPAHRPCQRRRRQQPRPPLANPALKPDAHPSGLHHQLPVSQRRPAYHCQGCRYC